MTPKWEYRTRAVSNHKAESAMLDEMGSEGWELVSVVKEADTFHLLYFKRPAR